MKAAVITTSIALLPAIFSLAPAGQAPAARGTAQFAYVSAQRIFAESTEGKAEVAKITALQQQKATELRSRTQTLETTRQQLAQAAEGPARMQLQQQELQQRTDLERATVQAQTDLQALQRQVQTDVQNRVRSVLDDVTKGQNIQLVLNSDTSVVWAGPGLDLTTVVIERLNSKPATVPPKP